MRVRAERDDNNLAFHQDSPPVVPQHLVTLRPAKFIQDVLMPFRDRLMKLWTVEQIEEIEADHRGLHKLYRDDENVRKASTSTTSTRFSMTPGLCQPFRSSPRILWWPRDRLSQHHCGRERFLDTQVGDG
jgi:hypothetical protein